MKIMPIETRPPRARLTPETNAKGQILALFGLLAFLSFILYSATTNSASIANTILLFTLLTALVAYCTSIIWIESQKQSLFSPLSLFAAAVLVHFAASGLLYPDSSIFSYPRNYDYINASVLYVISFTLIYHIISTLMLKGARFHNIRFSNVHWSERKAYIVIIFLLLIGVAARALIIYWNVYLQTSLSTLEGARHIKFIGTIRQFELLPNYAAYISLILSFSNRSLGKLHASKVAMWFGVGLVVLNLAYWLPTGKKFPIIATVIIPMMIMYLYDRRLPPLRILVTSTIFIAALFPITHAYRVSQAHALSGQNVSGFGSTLATIRDALDQAPEAKEWGARNQTFGRLNQLEPVAASIRIITNKESKLRGGLDYANVATNMIPGFLWADKPRVMYGNEFGRLTYMIRQTDMYTAISVTLIGESFLNFHIGGVLVGGLLAAIFCSTYLVGRLGLSRETSTLLYVIATPTILYIGASFALYISAMIQTMAVLFILAKFMEQDSKVRIPRHA